eukprot:m.341856 g.341856  ORF g.341856 m.341856 type:complete len:435 (+) comp20607_c0_seq1:63-1367(+)
MAPPAKKAKTNVGDIAPNEIKDAALAVKGHELMALAERNMPALVKYRSKLAGKKLLEGMRLAVNLHVTKETAVLIRTLKAAGAEIAMTGCNAFSTQDEIAAVLAEEGVHVYATHGCSNSDFHRYIEKVIDFQPHILVDDGCDLCVAIHKRGGETLDRVLGGCEQTTSGVIRLRNMAKDSALNFPMIATNDNKTKSLLDNYYGTGQSCLDAIMRASSLFIAGKVFVVAGYGWCGKGVAMRAKGLGAQVVVVEVHPFQALQAVYDGFRVMPMAEAAEIGDMFLTATSNKHVIRVEHVLKMKDGAVLCNAGQFYYEIDVDDIRKLQTESKEVRTNMEQITLNNGKCVFLLGGGNLVNLSCAEGHPSEVMATSFLGQMKAVEHIAAEHKTLPKDVINLPEHLDDEIAALQLDAMGIQYDRMTKGQEEYMQSWQEGHCE